MSALLSPLPHRRPPRRHLKARHNDQQSCAASLEPSQVFFPSTIEELHATHGEPAALLCARQEESEMGRREIQGKHSPFLLTLTSFRFDFTLILKLKKKLHCTKHMLMCAHFARSIATVPLFLILWRFLLQLYSHCSALR